MIAVLGATGRIGRHVAQGLADAGAPARALVRDPRADGLPLQSLRADLSDPASLRAAMEGGERLFLLTPHGPDQDLHEAAALAAAIAAGVQRIVKVSGGAPSLGPNGPTSTAVAHWRSERAIEASGLGFTFLRPGFLMQNLLDTAAPLAASAGVLAAPMGRAPIAMVDARDVAACAVAVLLDPDPIDTALQLTGPRGVTYPQLAAALGIPYVDVPPALAETAMSKQGRSDWEIDHALRMAAYFRSGADGSATDTVERVTGVAPRSLDQFLREHAASFGGLAAERSATTLGSLVSLVPSTRRS